MGKHLHDVKGESYKGERIYAVSHQQFYSSLGTSKQILKTFVKKMAQTLEVFCELGIVHSDIKPDNILVKLNDDASDISELKFIDFGSAFQFESIDQIAGTTPEYLPPEIIEF